MCTLLVTLLNFISLLFDSFNLHICTCSYRKWQPWILFLHCAIGSARSVLPALCYWVCSLGATCSVLLGLLAQCCLSATACLLCYPLLLAAASSGSSTCSHDKYGMKSYSCLALTIICPLTHVCIMCAKYCCGLSLQDYVVLML